MESTEKEMNEEVIAQMLSGKRPENMSYEEFRIKRKMIGNFLKRKSRGKFFYVAKEVSTIKDENGKDKKVIKSYGPYRKNA